MIYISIHLFLGLLKEVEQQQEYLQKDTESVGKKRGCLVRVQQALISAQEIGDQKLQIIQQLQDLIENKARQLDIDYRNLGKFLTLCYTFPKFLT